MKFYYNVFSDVLQCTELNVKLYKNLLKSLYGETPDINLFLEEFFEIFVAISNKPKEYFEALSPEQLFLLLLQLRTNTFGNSCQIVINKETESKEKQNIYLNLDNIKEEIFNVLELIHQPLIINNVQLCLKPPSVTKLRQFNPFDPILNYLDSCTVLTEKDSTFKIQTNEEAKRIVELLPPKAFVDIMTTCNNYIEKLDGINFIAFVKEQKYFLGFSQPLLESLVWFAKLFFSEDITTLYENIFYLSKHSNMSPLYIENECTPGEYVFYTKKLSAILNQKNAENGVE
jgi:hypothetical protein